MTCKITGNPPLVRQAGRCYVPQRAQIGPAPGGPDISGLTTVSDISHNGIGLLQTYPLAAGARFVVVGGPDMAQGQQYEVVYCQEQAGVFRIGARRVIGPSQDTSAEAPERSHAVPA